MKRLRKNFKNLRKKFKESIRSSVLLLMSATLKAEQVPPEFQFCSKSVLYE